MLTNFKEGDKVIIVDSEKHPMPFGAMRKSIGKTVTLKKVNTDLPFARWILSLDDDHRYFYREEYLRKAEITLEQISNEIKIEIGL